MSKEVVDFREATGEEALWTNSMFSGMPAYQISVNYKANLVKYFDNIFKLGLPHPAGLVFLYMIGFFILLITLKIDPWLSIVGAIAFGFSSYFFIGVFFAYHVVIYQNNLQGLLTSEDILKVEFPFRSLMKKIAGDIFPDPSGVIR